MRKPIWCVLGWHPDVWKFNPDGDRFKQCLRCGRDAGILANEASLAATRSTGATSAVAAALVEQALRPC